MTLEAALAAAATLVAVAFALSTLERWMARRQLHELAWTLALALFAAGSVALWVGAALGWGTWSFKLFYLFGAIVNVPMLAVGTVALLAGVRTGRLVFGAVVLLSVFCAGWILATPIIAAIPTHELPRGSEVFGVVPRVMAAVGSGVGAMVVFGGAVWSAIELLRKRRAVPGLSARRLALANGLIALGTLVLGAGGLLNSVLGEMDAFTVSLVVGISIIFAGFLTTMSAKSTPASRSMPPWIREVLDEQGRVDVPVPTGSGLN
jgi:hypothetical protein